MSLGGMCANDRTNGPAPGTPGAYVFLNRKLPTVTLLSDRCPVALSALARWQMFETL